MDHHERAGFCQLTLRSAEAERKYLSTDERRRYLRALRVITDPKDRTFCEILHWTGCRPSEALNLTAHNFAPDEGLVIIQSLKKRGAARGQHFRPIPVPAAFMRRLEIAHGLQHRQADPILAAQRLWPFSRTKGWRLVKAVMDEAGIAGLRGCGRGLRHGYGVHAALTHVPESRIRKWLGHSSLATTAIYLDMAGAEDRAIAERMWR